MQADQSLSFDRYRLDVPNEQLWQGTQLLPLTSKAFAVLRYLVEHTGQLVTKAELFDALWPEIAVSDGALTFCIVELRKALGDDAKAPRFIETVHRRGYRFIGEVQSPESKVQGPKTDLAPSTQHPAPVLVGREADLAQLHKWLAKALSGERQIVFVTGEPGIGKTTLIEAFVAEVSRSRRVGMPHHSDSPHLAGSVGSAHPTSTHSLSSPHSHSHLPPPDPWLARGQCIEHYGPGEPYMPILEALGRLCRESDGEQLVMMLKQHAPTWLVQMPTLLNAAELETLQRKTAGATRERMLREMGEAIEAITVECPLVLVLEDLHWSDASTLELLALLARRREFTRLLVIGTYRPVDVIVQEHPLRAVKQELQLHGLCAELPLGLLSETQVAEYLEQRFCVGAHGRAPLQTVAKVIHQRTDGNPLFMVTAVDDLMSQGVLASVDGHWTVPNELATIETRVPDSLQQLITQQIERLPAEDRRMLEVAGVTGMEFSAAAVAAGVETETETVEECCEGLARRGQFLRASGTAEWPDGTVAGRYSFLHALYQEVIYNRIPAGRRQRLHLQISERQEQGYGERAREIAAELAVHFEQGRDYHKALPYLQHAGENAVRRSAHLEAISLLTKGLALLKHLPDTSERTQRELALQIALSDALVPVKGYTAPDVETAVTRARELCQQLGETPQLFPVLERLALFYMTRGGVQRALELSQQMMRLAQSVQDPYLLSMAHQGLGRALYSLGELTSARSHLEQTITLYDPQKHSHSTVYSPDPRVECLSYMSLTLWTLGYPDEALKKSFEARALAEGPSHPFSLAFALTFSAVCHLFRREGQLARERAEAVITLATEQGFPYWLAWGRVIQGWVLAEQGQVEEGLVQIQQGLATARAMGAEVVRTGSLAMLAMAYAKAGRIEDGLSVLAEALALVDNTRARVSQAGLYVLKGWLLLFRAGGNQAETEACFLKAVKIARQQQAKSLELRATMSLARLWQSQGRDHEAHKMLSEIYQWFTEGFDTKDLQEAKALLEALGH